MFKSNKMIITRRMLAATGALAAFMFTAGAANIIHVSQLGDGSDGLSWETAFKTIPAGLTAAQNYDTVLVSNGTYTARFEIGKPVNLISLNGPDETVVHAVGGTSVNILPAGAGSLVSGFTVRGGGVAWGQGGNMRMQGNAVISNCVVTASWVGTVQGAGVNANSGLVTHCRIFGNMTTLGGAGVALDGSAILANSLVYNNKVSDPGSINNSGGGVRARGNSIIRNCTIVGNSAEFGGGVFMDASNAKIINSVVCGNTRLYQTVPNNVEMAQPAYGANVSYSCIRPLTGITGLGNTDAAPLLDAEYRPLPGSSSINSGVYEEWMAGATDLAGAPRVVDGNADMGAFEFDETAFDDLKCGFSVVQTPGADSTDATLTASVAGGNQSSLSYEWDFGNGYASGLAVETLNFGIGVHTVKLRVTDADNEVAEFILENAVVVGPSETFVVLGNAGAAYPYNDLAIAAADIQAAVDAVAEGGTVWVDQGTYSVAAPVKVDKRVNIIGVNGPETTIIHAPGVDNIRGVIISSVAANALLAGFTVRNGDGAGIYGGNIYMLGAATVSNCNITANARIGGGQSFGFGIFADRGLVTHCKIFEINGDGGSGTYGTGVSLGANAMLANSLVYNNVCGGGNGGAVYGSGIVFNCTITDNKCASGGCQATSGAPRMVNSIVYGNVTSDSDHTSVNITGNLATLYTCSYPVRAGATNIGNPPNLDPVTFVPQAGSSCMDKGAPSLTYADLVGTRTEAAIAGPVLDLVSAWVNSADFADMRDFYGTPRNVGGRMDVGAVEFVMPEGITCGITISPDAGEGELDATVTATVIGSNEALEDLVYHWDFDNDGAYETTTFTNEIKHVFGSGSHTVNLKVVNGAGEEAFASTSLFVWPLEVFVVPENVNSRYPYHTWETAATNFVDAMGAVAAGGFVTVTNGVYAFDAGPVLNVTRPLTVRSVNGWEHTTISAVNRTTGNGATAVRLQNAAAVIEGFTIRDGRGDFNNGANLWLNPGTARNCRITGNLGTGNQGYGSVYATGNSLLENCVIDGNKITTVKGTAGVDLADNAIMRGCLVFGNTNFNAATEAVSGAGGVRVRSGSPSIINCTIVDNWTVQGAKGAGLFLESDATVVNTVVAFNGVCDTDGVVSAGYVNNLNTTAVPNPTKLSHSVVWPLSSGETAPSGFGAVDPKFRSVAAKNFRLNGGSPLRDAGLWQEWMEGAVDLDDAPRVESKGVDVGAYECQIPRETIIVVK